jgi:bacterioferritin-associated ferredoxin
MILCHCMGVSDKSVRRAIQCGASSVRDVARACGAGTGCGGCRGTVQEILSTELAAASAAAPSATAEAPAPR